MSEQTVTIERTVPGGKKERREVTKTFYDLLNPEPKYNGGWKLAAPAEVEGEEPEGEGEEPAKKTRNRKPKEAPAAEDLNKLD